MKKVLVIVRREFLMAIEQKAYLVSMVLFPLLILVIGGMQMFSTGRLKAGSGSTAIGVVDRAGVIDFDATEASAGSERPSNDDDDHEAAQHRIIPYQDVSVAVQDVRTGKLAVLCVVAEDYMKGGAFLIEDRLLRIELRL